MIFFHFKVFEVLLFLQSIRGPRRARTVDPRIKSPLLYRLSYRPHCDLVTSSKTIGKFHPDYRLFAARLNRSRMAVAMPSPVG